MFLLNKFLRLYPKRMEVYKADPRFTNFVPKTAIEAVDRYTRCRNKGLSAMMIPECLIECAVGLPPDEVDKFEAWLINPSGDLSACKLIEDRTICADNDRIFEENLERVSRKIALAEMKNDNDEDSEDEKLIEEEDSTRVTRVETLWERETKKAKDKLRLR